MESFPSPHLRILHGGTQAYYAPAPDIVQVPDPSRFVFPEAYQATLFHELIHSTGHRARLNPFGDEAYSKEELVAEMGASFLCAFTGIKEAVFQNSVAYLQGWFNRLQEDKTIILNAATRAFQAVNYFLNLKAETGRVAQPTMKSAA